MFKKRIRVAQVTFLTILVLMAFVACLWKVSGKYSKGTGELTVKAGDVKVAEGVTIQVGTVDMLWENYTQWKNRTNPENDTAYFYKTRTAELRGSKVVTALGYEKQTALEQRKRIFFWKLMPEFSQRYVQGSHRVTGSEFAYDLEWYLTDGYSTDRETKYRIKDYVTLADEDVFLYYYDGLGPNYYEAAPFLLESGRSYIGNCLCELDGALYGYVGAEPQVGFSCRYSYSGQLEEDRAGRDAFSSASMSYSFLDFETTCEEIDDRDFAEELSEFGEPELSITVRKGIYRFGEDGTAECVIELGEYGDGFPYLWLVANEEEHTLTLIGAKENRLLAYNCCLETGTVEEVVLWDATNTPEELEEWWYETASNYELADMVTEAGRSYLCRTATYGSQVNLTVFENGSRVFEGEVLQRESNFEGRLDFSMTTNEMTWTPSVADKVEIILQE